MRRLLIVAGAALVAIIVYVMIFTRAEWRADEGGFLCFLAAIAIACALVVNSVLARRRDGVGPFGVGLPTVTQTFWSSMGVIAAAAAFILSVPSHSSGPDNYAIGLGALMIPTLGLLALIVGGAFLLVRWWSFRLALAATAGGTAAFACMAATWWH